ncbi:MAG: hypothetical protein PVF70_13625 [Anaerolineales bacterium]|jgi:hypothetical protein
MDTPRNRLAFLNTWKLRAEGSKIASLFVLMVLGILANWFWNLGWAFLQDPEAGISFGSPLEIAVRVVLAFIAAGLTFVPTYNKISNGANLSWVPYFLAFQNGFFWEAALDAILRQF